MRNGFSFSFQIPVSHLMDPQQILASLQMGIAFIICTLVCTLLLPFSQSQQPYQGNISTDCTNAGGSAASAVGFSCNNRGQNCYSFLLFRSNSPYNSVPTIADLMSIDSSNLAQINGVSVYSVFADGELVVIPLNCTCSGSYFQAISFYSTQDDDTYFSVSNNTYQGFISCQALMHENNYTSKKLVAGVILRVPLRCACPSTDQINSGMKYLFSYSAYLNDSSARLRFGVHNLSLVDANSLTVENSTVFPFTTFLVSLLNEPVVPGNITSPLSSPRLSPPTISTSKKKSKKVVYVAIGVPCSVFLLVLLAVFCSKRSPDGHGFDKPERCYQEVKEGMEMEDELHEGLPDIGDGLKAYTFEEILVATKNFSEECRISCSVYCGFLDGAIRTIKKVKGDASEEAEILRKFNHLNLISFFGICLEQRYSYIVYEYAENGPLHAWIHGSKVFFLSWIQRVQIALDVASGLHYLHHYTEPPYVHKDVNASNVLLDGGYRGKVANFSLSRSTESKAEADSPFLKQCAEPKCYIAPEYLEKGSISPKIDVYAYGVVILELITGKEATVSCIEALAEILRDENPDIDVFMDPSLRGNYPIELVMVMIKMIDACLKRDPSKRPTMDEVVKILTRTLGVSLTWEPTVIVPEFLPSNNFPAEVEV